MLGLEFAKKAAQIIFWYCSAIIFFQELYLGGLKFGALRFANAPYVLRMLWITSRSFSGSHGPPWEPIHGFGWSIVGWCNVVNVRCVPTRERGNEKVCFELHLAV